MTLAPSGGATTVATMEFDGGEADPVDHTGWKIWISGGASYALPAGFPHDGQQNDDPFPIPDVPQGSKWQGTPRLSGPEREWEYRLMSYSWTFPSGVVKGYGKFDLLQEPPGEGGGESYWNYNGDVMFNNHVTWDLAQNPTDYPFTEDDLKWDGFGTQDHVTDIFYWGPNATGPSEVRVTAKFQKFNEAGEVVDTFEDTGWAKFNIIRPAGAIEVLQWGTAGLNTQPTSDGQHWLSMDKNRMRDANPKPIGIQYDAYIVKPTTVDEFYVGAFSVFQLQKYKETRTIWEKSGLIRSEEKGFYTTGSPLTRVTNPDGTWKRAWDHPVLDSLNGGVGYGFRLNEPRYGPGIPLPETYAAPVIDINLNTNHLYGNDSPRSPLVFEPTLWDAETWTRSDHFVDYLMYNPDFQADGFSGKSTDSIWIPVGQLHWEWSATARYDGTVPSPQWQETDQAQLKTFYVETKNFPTWTAHQGGGFYQWFEV